MNAIIEVRPWHGNQNAKRRKDRRYDAELPASSGVLSGCPFCGGNGTLAHTHTASYWVECEDCGAQVSGEWSGDASKPQDHKRAAQSAINAWNRRA